MEDSKRTRVEEEAKDEPAPSTEDKSTQKGASRSQPGDQLGPETSRPSVPTSSGTGLVSTNGETEGDEEESTTVYCDACGKARILKPAFAAEFDLDAEWTCPMAISEGCAQTDDELVEIAGELFAKVLDAAGIKTRKDLSRSSAQEFDSGPWEAYIQSWITAAQDAELNDAMKEIIGDDTVIHLLRQAGIDTPNSILEASDDLLSGVYEGDPEIFRNWREQAAMILEEEANSWMIGL